MLTLLVRGDARNQVPPPLRRDLRRLVGRAMKAAGVDSAQVCLSLTDDAEILELNRTYAGEDHATDVLSFSQQEGEGATLGLPKEEGTILGDIVISVDTALRQAGASGHDLLAELFHLSVHGLCHLLGYDHASKEEEQQMFGYESRLREVSRAPGRVGRIDIGPSTSL